MEAEAFHQKQLDKLDESVEQQQATGFLQPSPAAKWPVCPAVGPVCLDQGRAGEPAPPDFFGGRPGERFYPLLGGASRAFGLPRAAAKRLLRAEARTHLHGPLGRMTDTKP